MVFGDFTIISYWVLTDTNARVQMSPQEIAQMTEAGYELDVRIHQEYDSSRRTKLIYG